jgi:hypothetical protein
MFPSRSASRSRPGRVAAATLTCALAAGCTGAPREEQPPRAAAPDSPTSPRGKGRCPTATAYRRPPADRPRYAISVRVPARGDLVTGRLRVRFTPDAATRRLVFRLWPNGPRQSEAGARLVAGEVTERGHALESRLPNPTTMVVPLGRRLRAGETITVALPFALQVPGPTLDRISRRGSAVRLGSFFPLLAWEHGAGWARDPPTSVLAETSSSPVADFRVRVVVPRGTSVLASGREDRSGVWRARAVRDFALAVGRFEVAARRVLAPRPVTVTVGVASAVERAPEPFLDRVERALQGLARRYGPYPWPTLSLAVMPDLGRAGIEYPTMIFQGEDSLEWATTHEVAHSWFYSLVGNNQARDPWLDEGVTSYAQARVDGVLPFFRETPVPEDARGHLGEPMSYWERHEPSYFGGVYVQGVLALAALGPGESVDCALATYVTRNAYSIATPRTFIASVGTVIPDAGSALERFGISPEGT